MQWYFLNQSYQLKSQLFDQNVNEALSNVAKKLERQEAYNFLLKKAVNTRNATQKRKERAQANTQLKQNSAARKESYAQFLSKEQQKADSLFTLRDSMLRARYPVVLAYDATKAQDTEEEVQQELVQFVDPFGGIHQQVLQQRVPKLSFTKQNPVDSIRQYIVFDPQYGPKLITLAKPRLSNISRTDAPNSPDVQLVQQYLDSVQETKKNVLQDLAQEFGSAKMPLNKRIQAHMVDQLLRKELKNKGITGSFTYQIQQGNAKNKLGTPLETTEHLHTDEVYKTQLFPKEMIKESFKNII
jgi:two-component system phosphate regulon sensor histidine kinase PhoR